MTSSCAMRWTPKRSPSAGGRVIRATRQRPSTRTRTRHRKDSGRPPSRLPARAGTPPWASTFSTGTLSAHPRIRTPRRWSSPARRSAMRAQRAHGIHSLPPAPTEHHRQFPERLGSRSLPGPVRCRAIAPALAARLSGSSSLWGTRAAGDRVLRRKDDRATRRRDVPQCSGAAATDSTRQLRPLIARRATPLAGGRRRALRPRTRRVPVQSACPIEAAASTTKLAASHARAEAARAASNCGRPGRAGDQAAARRSRPAARPR